MSLRATRRAGAVAAVAAMVLTLGACGGGSSDKSSDTTAAADVTTTTVDTPPPTYPADLEAKFLEASKDPRAGKLGQIDDATKLQAGRASCADLKSGSTGKQVYDAIRKELSGSDVKDEELGFFIGTAVGAMCPDQADQLKKGF